MLSERHIHRKQEKQCRNKQLTKLLDPERRAPAIWRARLMIQSVDSLRALNGLKVRAKGHFGGNCKAWHSHPKIQDFRDIIDFFRPCLSRLRDISGTFTTQGHVPEIVSLRFCFALSTLSLSPSLHHHQLHPSPTQQQGQKRKQQTNRNETKHT